MAKRNRSNVSLASGAGLSAATDLLAISAASGIAGARAASGFPVLAEDVALAAADPSDITDELEKGGPAFGKLVEAVGLAIARSQKELDLVLAATAKVLSETDIEVVAVYDQELDDETGEMTNGTPHLQKLPLINYLMPTAYHFSEATIRATMNVSEFSSANGFNIQSKSRASSAGGSVGYSSFRGFSIGGGASTANNSSEVSGGSTYGQDYAAGQIQMEVKLAPRADIALPKPFIVQKGPKVTLNLQGTEPILDAAGAEIGRRAIVRAFVRKKDGSPNAQNTNLNADVDNANLSVVFKNVDGTPDTDGTDSNGILRIDVERKGAAFTPGTPMQGNLRVNLGLASDIITLNL